MDYYDKVNQFLKAGQLNESIVFCERELKKIGPTKFHWVLGKNLLHLQPKLTEFMHVNFHKKHELLKVKAFYSELNGFSINYDKWFLDIVAFEEKEDFHNDDLDWLCDSFWGTNNPEYFSLTGWEELQNIFEDYHVNEKYEIPTEKTAADLAEFLVINRLQELFKTVILTERRNQTDWAQIPFGITAHDYDLILEI